MNINQIKNKLEQVAESLYGAYQKHQRINVIIPLLFLRRLDCIIDAADPAFDHIENSSGLSLASMAAEPEMLLENYQLYLEGFCGQVEELIKAFEISSELKKLAKNNLLATIHSKFLEIDLSPTELGNIDMGQLFEMMVSECSGSAHEANGEFYTPLGAVELMTCLVVRGEKLKDKNEPITVYDPTCGVGNLLSNTQSALKGKPVSLFGQEINPWTWAIAAAEQLLTSGTVERIALGNTLILVCLI